MKFKFILSFFLVGILAFNVSAQHDFITQEGDQVPDFRFTDTDGKSYSIADFKGKIVLVNFFATWCRPCMMEVPELKSLHEKYGKKEFVIIMLGRKEDMEKMKQFKSDKEITFIVAPDSEREIFNRFAYMGIPRNVLVDDEGTIIFQSVGYDHKSFKRLEGMVNNYTK